MRAWRNWRRSGRRFWWRGSLRKSRGLWPWREDVISGDYGQSYSAGAASRRIDDRGAWAEPGRHFVWGGLYHDFRPDLHRGACAETVSVHVVQVRHPGRIETTESACHAHPAFELSAHAH